MRVVLLTANASDHFKLEKNPQVSHAYALTTLGSAFTGGAKILSTKNRWTATATLTLLLSLLLFRHLM